MMMHSIKSAITNPQSSCYQIKCAFFHSTTFLERGRRNNYWNSKFKSNKSFGRYRRSQFKENMIRDTNAYVEYMFQSWDPDYDRDEQPNKGPSWFRRNNNGSRRNNSNQGDQSRGRRGFSFCEDDGDVETMFRTVFGDRFSFWSFVDGDYRYSRNSSRHSKKSSRRWREQSEDEYEYEYDDSPDDTQNSRLSSERIALGLSASGPLKLEDVKNAYRASALKWHPDRHQGSSKADAEEKFKLCTAAYQSLCDSLAVN